MRERGQVEPGTVLAGCRIVRRLGRGGMAGVYLAIEVATSRQVALKVRAPTLAADRRSGAGSCGRPNWPAR